MRPLKVRPVNDGLEVPAPNEAELLADGPDFLPRTVPVDLAVLEQEHDVDGRGVVVCAGPGLGVRNNLTRGRPTLRVELGLLVEAPVAVRHAEPITGLLAFSEEGSHERLERGVEQGNALFVDGVEHMSGLKVASEYEQVPSEGLPFVPAFAPLPPKAS